MPAGSPSGNSERPRVVEVVGPAGSGKSTLVAALCAGPPGARPVSIYCSPRNLPLWAWSACKLIPQLRTSTPPGVKPWRKRRWMIRLQAAEGILHREAVRDKHLIVFDQGPIYTLARLGRVMQSSQLLRGRPPSWSSRVPFWAEALDAIIILNAPDEVLLDRIHTRSKPHSFRKASEDKAQLGLDDERAVYEAVVDELTAARDSLRVIRFDTATVSTAGIAAAVVELLDRNPAIQAASPDGALHGPPSSRLPSETPGS